MFSPKLTFNHILRVIIHCFGWLSTKVSFNSANFMHWKTEVVRNTAILWEHNPILLNTSLIFWNLPDPHLRIVHDFVSIRVSWCMWLLCKHISLFTLCNYFPLTQISAMDVHTCNFSHQPSNFFMNWWVKDGKTNWWVLQANFRSFCASARS